MKIAHIYLGTSLGVILIFFALMETLSIKQKEKSEVLLAKEAPTEKGSTKAEMPSNGDTRLGFTHQEQKIFQDIFARFHSGDFQTALNSALKAYDTKAKSPEFQKWLLSTIPQIYTSQSWALIQTLRCQEAIPLLEASKKLKPELMETRKGLAFCYYLEKAYDQAEEDLIAYFAFEPKDAQMILMYADLLEGQERFEEAYEFLFAKMALDDELATKIKTRTRSMKAKLSESSLQSTETSAHFVISFRSVEHEAIVAIAIETLETALSEMNEIFGLKYPKNILEVVFYPESQFAKAVSYGPSWAKGLFDGRLRISIPSAFLAKPEDPQFLGLLRHELFHALLSEQIERREVPYWFNEGIAMYLECPKGCVLEKSSTKSLGGKFLEQDAFLKRFVDLNQNSAALVYQQSIFLIHKLVQLTRYDSDSHPLQKLLSNLDARSDLSSDGLLAAFSLDFKTLHTKASEAWEKP